MNALILILILAFMIIALAISFYLLVYYCHPDEKGFGSSIFCKILVILGFLLCWAQILLLPLDVMNSMDNDNQFLDMQLAWYIIYMIIAFFLVILLPFGIFFYESDPEKTFRQRMVHAIIMTIASIIISCLIIFCSYAGLRYAKIPVQAIVPNGSGQTTQDISIKIPVGVPIYITGILAFFGWIFFTLFVGVGLVALPLDLILEWKNRPIPRSSAEMRVKKEELKEMSKSLIDQGSNLRDREIQASYTTGFLAKRKEVGKISTDYNKWLADVMEMEKEYDTFDKELKIAEINPLVYWFKLFLGILFAILSFIIWLHMLKQQPKLFLISLLYMCIRIKGAPVTPFLNDILLVIQDRGLTIVSGGLFTLFVLYLLSANIKGNFKFGVRIPFLFTMHPMKKDETFMNSFLFNIMINLLCSIAIIQFSEEAFQAYVLASNHINAEIAINQIFGVQIKYLYFFTYFYKYNIFVYLIMIWTFFTTIYFIFRPSDKKIGKQQGKNVKQ